MNIADIDAEFLLDCHPYKLKQRERERERERHVKKDLKNTCHYCNSTSLPIRGCVKVK
jgi:hypothetical protein